MVTLGLPLACSAAFALQPPPPPASPSSCSSDGRNPPTALLERFINADCADCWTGEPPAPAERAVALDWIAPGPLGDDGALSAVARRDALARLAAIGRPLPDRTLSVGRTLQPAPAGTARLLRVAYGLPVGNYIGTSIEFQGAALGHWRAWLVLVETLPPGLEGSPVERNLVRNSLQLDWVVPAPAPAEQTFKELRPMQIPAGAQPERLNVVGWIEEASGNGAAGPIVAMARSACGPR